MDAKDMLNAIGFIRPNAEFLFVENKVQWLDKSQTEPTIIEIEAGLIAYKAKLENDEAQAATDKASATAKLEALGLTAYDLKALGL